MPYNNYKINEKITNRIKGEIYNFTFTEVLLLFLSNKTGQNFSKSVKTLIINKNLNPLTKWTLNDLIEHCVQQIKHTFFPSAHDMLTKRGQYGKPKKQILTDFKRL